MKKAKKKQILEYPKIWDDALKLKRTDIPLQNRKEFYKSDEWKTARDKFLSEQPVMKCNKCGRTPDPNFKKAPIKLDRSEHDKELLRKHFNRNRILVDHKLPLRYYWTQRLEPENFQLLCGCCNEKKLNTVSWHDFKEATIRLKKKNET